MQEQYTLSIAKQNNAKDISIRKINILVMLFIAVLILFRDVGNFDINRFVFISLATFACLISDKSRIYCLLAFLTPLAPGISLTYITSIAMVIVLIRQPKLYIQPVGIICMALILFIELLSAFRGFFSLVDYLRFAGIFLFSFLRTCDLKNEYDNEGIIHCYIFGFWTAMASVLGQMLNTYSIEQILSLGVRFGNTREILDTAIEGMILSYNPNGLGFLCLLAGLFSLLLYQKNNKKWYLLSFSGATLLGLMTQSRAFLLVYTLSMLLYTLLSCRSLRSILSTLFVFCVGASSLIVGVLWLIPEYVESLLLRFNDADISNGRGDILTYYFNDMFEYVDRLIFGVGLQNYTQKYGFLMSAHNATQEVIIAWGIIGLLLVATLFIVVFYNGRRHNSKANLVQYLPLVMYLFAIQSGQGFADTSGMLRIMVAYSAILIPMKYYSSQENA